MPKLEISLQHYIKEEQDEYKDKEYRVYYLIALIILLASIFTFGYIKKETLKEKEQEISLLKYKVNESF